MSEPPQHVRALQQSAALELTWNDGTVRELPFRFLRGECPCASCVDELTGRRILRVESLPADIHPVSLAFSGNYALKISWSDGHNTGLYT